MTKNEAMQNALGTIFLAEIEKDIHHYIFKRRFDCYILSIFTGKDMETAKRILEKFRHIFVDGTSMIIVDLERTYCVTIEWRWQ